MPKHNPHLIVPEGTKIVTCAAVPVMTGDCSTCKGVQLYRELLGGRGQRDCGGGEVDGSL